VTRESILESMSSFKLEDAHCYDPNEEIKLRSVMADVGEVRGLDPRAGGQDPGKGQGGGGARGWGRRRAAHDCKTDNVDGTCDKYT
jgi:hypothetical protein